MQDSHSPAINPLSQQELDHLAEVREVCQTANTAGWRRILEQMKSFVNEAMEDMVGAGYAADSVKAGLQTRWQQRISMLRGVEKYIATCEEEKRMLLEQVEKRSVPPDAEQDREDPRWETAYRV